MQYCEYFPPVKVIMPLKRENWADMMDDILRADNNGTRAFYSFGNVLFLGDMPRANVVIPSSLHMVSHVYRYVTTYHSLFVPLSS